MKTWELMMIQKGAYGKESVCFECESLDKLMSLVETIEKNFDSTNTNYVIKSVDNEEMIAETLDDIGGLR